MRERCWGAVLFVVLLGVAAVPASAEDAPAASGVRAVLELSREFYYTGESLPIRISIGNEGSSKVDNPVRSSLAAGLLAFDESGAALTRADATIDEPARPESLSPMGFYGAIVDATAIYPAIRDGGKFQIRWSADGVTSATVLIQVIPLYDPTKNYRATVSTEEGPIVIDLFQDRSPIAVKAFVDMAHSGVYDGLLIHEVHPDELLVGGSPAASGIERRVVTFPAEQSSMPVVAGTVLLRPVGAAPPANSSPFMIVLRPRPEWTGQATVLGQVVSGLDVAKKISRRPSTQQSTRPFFKPLKDIEIRGIVIEEVPAAGPPATPAG
jgi:cyclophilin family peptidyl-prolyl cis-trans isomerase